MNSLLIVMPTAPGVIIKDTAVDGEAIMVKVKELPKILAALLNNTKSAKIYRDKC